MIGDIVNTNAAHISAKLAEMGISQYYQGVVGDNPERLTEALKNALEKNDIVITSGGLGPTYDDLTKETAAKLMRRKLHRDSDTFEAIQTYFKNTGREMSPNNAKQADIPDGSTVFKNYRGTAPGIAIEDFENSKIIIMLPGPPRELEPMFDNQVMPYLMKFTNGVLLSKNVNIFGLGEAAIENHLHDLMTNSQNPTVAPYVGTGEVRLRVTARAANHEECEKLCDETIDIIMASPVGKFVYGIDAGSLESALIAKLKEKSLTIATAESLTGGLVGKRLTDIPGASEVYLGGIVSYSDKIKRELLGVPSEILEKYTAVSPETAIFMARGAREALGADIAVSTTGIAGPGPDEYGRPAGLVYIAVSSVNGETVKKLTLAPGRNARDFVRYLSASNAFALARIEADKIN